MASWSRVSLVLRGIRRTYATISSDSAAELAQAASAPLKIKERREETVKDFARTPPEERRLTLEEKRRLVRPPVRTKYERSRLRGVRVMRRADGSIGEQIVGQRIYLPNIIFTMIPNHTPPGRPYNPYEATFYISNYLTKTDVRSYLHAIYGVECTYIRTDNYFMPMKHRKGVAIGRMANKGNKKTHKRAVVGLKEPFYYPQMVEDMNGKDRWLRENAIEDTFRIKALEEAQKAVSVKSTTGTRENNISALAQQWDSRKKIIRRLWERREERERATRDLARQLQEAREVEK
ncbi:hypothetical protein ACEPAI_3764 [Sanghuangporus weigelae]